MAMSAKDEGCAPSPYAAINDTNNVLSKCQVWVAAPIAKNRIGKGGVLV